MTSSVVGLIAANWRSLILSSYSLLISSRVDLILTCCPGTIAVTIRSD
ncbi:hypothetical protein [Nostoc sp. PA-18-2419]|nr:hypothetical protein [Nostoc sp. PA-18-2419]